MPETCTWRRCLREQTQLRNVMWWTVRKTTDAARLLDDAEVERQMEAKRAEIQVYRQSRTEMSDRRERDRKLRNSLKALQFKLCEQMQVCLSWSRDLSVTIKRNFILLPHNLWILCALWLVALCHSGILLSRLLISYQKFTDYSVWFQNRCLLLLLLISKESNLSMIAFLLSCFYVFWVRNYI